MLRTLGCGHGSEHGGGIQTTGIQLLPTEAVTTGMQLRSTEAVTERDSGKRNQISVQGQAGDLCCK